MSSSRVAPTRVRTAIGLSVALHLCALLLVSAHFGGTLIDSRETVDTAPAFRITTVTRRTPAPPAIAISAAPRPPRALIAVEQRRQVPSPFPPRVRPPHPSRTAAEFTRSAVVARAPARLPQAAPAVLIAATAVPLRVVVVAPPTPSPTPAPTPAAGTTPAPAASGSFSGLFSQNYPPALPTVSIVESIRERLGGHGAIRIDVDETGRATGIEFIGPPVDASAAGDVRAQLRGVVYVPADCNGLHCAGSLQISY